MIPPLISMYFSIDYSIYISQNIRKPRPLKTGLVNLIELVYPLISTISHSPETQANAWLPVVESSSSYKDKAFH